MECNTSYMDVSERKLTQRLVDAAEEVAIGCTYRHYKNKLYTVLDLAILESNTEVCVIYQAQYGERLKFIRVLSSWLEEVEYEGRVVKRFTKIEQ